MESTGLKEIFDIIWIKKFAILFITLICIVFGAVYSIFFTIPKYESYTSLVLVKSGEDSKKSSISQNDIKNSSLIIVYKKDVMKYY